MVSILAQWDCFEPRSFTSWKIHINEIEPFIKTNNHAESFICQIFFFYLLSPSVFGEGEYCFILNHIPISTIVSGFKFNIEIGGQTKKSDKTKKSKKLLQEDIWKIRINFFIRKKSNLIKTLKIRKFLIMVDILLWYFSTNWKFALKTDFKCFLTNRIIYIFAYRVIFSKQIAKSDQNSNCGKDLKWEKIKTEFWELSFAWEKKE